MGDWFNGRHLGPAGQPGSCPALRLRFSGGLCAGSQCRWGGWRGEAKKKEENILPPRSDPTVFGEEQIPSGKLPGEQGHADHWRLLGALSLWP